MSQQETTSAREYLKKDLFFQRFSDARIEAIIYHASVRIKNKCFICGANIHAQTLRRYLMNGNCCQRCSEKCRNASSKIIPSRKYEDYVGKKEPEF